MSGRELSARADAAGNGCVGRALKRKEDPRLITGRATYVDDIVAARHAVRGVRPLARGAREDRLDRRRRRRRSAPACIAVFTGEDLELDLAAPADGLGPAGRRGHAPEHWPLAKGEVKHVGDPSPSSSATDRYAVVDAAEEVVVEYDPLPVVVDPEEALEDGSPLVHEEFGTNKVHEWSLGGGDLEAGFAEADVIVERRVVNHRTAGAAIEPRGVRRRLPRRQAHGLDARRRCRTSCGCSSRSCSASARSKSASSPPRSAAASAPSCRSTARRSLLRGPRASSAGR